MGERKGKLKRRQVSVLVWCRGQNQNRAGTDYGGDFAAGRLLPHRFFCGSYAGQRGWLDFRDPHEPKCPT